ncbi:MAG: DUF115 domain-containing protein [Chlamydiales bacterium]
MENSAIFDKNLELFSQKNPAGSVLLGFADTSHLSITKTHNEDNLVYHFPEGDAFFYLPESPNAEANGWFHHLNMGKTTTLYVYGLGLGIYYRAASSWLDESPERNLIFIEDDPAVVHRFLEIEEAEFLLKHPQVHIYLLRDVQTDQATYDRLTWTFVLDQIQVTAAQFYREKRAEAFAILKTKLLYESAMKNDIVDEFLNFGAPFFRNYYANLREMPSSYDGQKLFGIFRKIPAIICGAGPSLDRNAQKLKDLEDRALIFAGGSAMNVLNAAGIKPHFGAGIDPNQEQYERYRQQKAEEIPYFYRNRLEHRAFSTIQGPRLYIKGAGGYPLADWVDEQLHIEGEIIEEGHNIVNFCTEIAVALGCDPIIFVGVDLAYTEMKSYAEGVLEKADVSEEELSTVPRFELTPHLHKDIQGKNVYTLWKWLAESQWIAQFAKHHPEVTVVNASEGGIGMKGIENIPLEEVAKKLLTKDLQLKIMINDSVKEAKLNISSHQIKSVLNTLDVSLANAVEELIRLEKISSDQERTLAELRLHEEVSYTTILEIFQKVYHHVYPSDQKGVYPFLRKVAELNRELIQAKNSTSSS